MDSHFLLGAKLLEALILIGVLYFAWRGKKDADRILKILKEESKL